jgi:hypothetical protein
MHIPSLEPDPSISADDREELLWNLALELSSLNIRVRAASITSVMLDSPVEAAMLLHECVLLDQGFQEWEDAVRKQTLPFTIDPASANSTSTYESVYKFDSETMGYTFNYYWGFRALLANIALYLIKQLPSEPAFPCNGVRFSAVEAPSSSLRGRFEAARHKYAVHIMRGSHFALSPKSGHYGAYRISFGVLVALFAFQERGDLEGVRAATEAVRRLADEKGLTFAKMALGKYATPGGVPVQGCSSGRAA